MTKTKTKKALSKNTVKRVAINHPQKKKKLTALERELQERKRNSFLRAEMAWCDDRTSRKAVDKELLEVFAEILMEEMYNPHLLYASTRQLLEELNKRLNDTGDLSRSGYVVGL